jgi:hypothetical protein
MFDVGTPVDDRTDLGEAQKDELRRKRWENVAILVACMNRGPKPE